VLQEGKTAAGVCCTGDGADQAEKGPILAALAAAAAAPKVGPRHPDQCSTYSLGGMHGSGGDLHAPTGGAAGSPSKCCKQAVGNDPSTYFLRLQ
jgi:hypothetical protein